MREMIGAGAFYERDPMLLKGEIAAHYEGPRGPGSLPLKKETRHVTAIIAPNSPYRNCGDCMAWAYKAIAESPFPDVYIIIAMNQHSQEDGTTLSTFNTPLGMARVDQDLAKAIKMQVNDDAHATNHAIEVQLPFLLHAKSFEPERIKILPILISEKTDTDSLAYNIQEALIAQKKSAIFIVSNNMTHYGPLFHYVPFIADVQKNIYSLDRAAIDFIRRQDAGKFVNFAKEHNMNCGIQAIELLLRVLPPSNARLEQYYTSGDVLGDYKNAVGYAAIVFTSLDEKRKA